MSAERYVMLRCDHPGCPSSFRGDPGQTPSELRREGARDHNWYSVKVRSGLPIEHYWHDLCPIHAPQH
jgi:hypothetical protein